MSNNKPIIVKVLPRKAWPPYAGQSRLSFFRAKELKKKGYKLVLISFTHQNNLEEDDLKNLKKIFDEIIFITIRKIDFIEIAIKGLFFRLTKNIPLQASWLNSQKLINDFNNKIFYLQKKYKNIFLHIYSIRSYFLWDIIEKSKNPFVIDLVDSMTLNLKRKCSILKNFRNYFWKFEYSSTKFFEQNLPSFKYCKKYIVVSKLDKKYLKTKKFRNKKNILVSSIGYEMPKNLEKKINNNKTIIFFGSLSYEPNLSAIMWLIKKVMPLVWRVDKDILVNIAGGNPPEFLINICKNNKRLLLQANPISMTNCIKKATIAVAPLISGSGQQFKIIEAMSNGIPVLSTTKGSDPFGFEHNKDLFIADTPREFATSIIEICNNPKMRKSIRNNAFLNIKNKYSWEILVEELEKNIYSKI